MTNRIAVVIKTLNEERYIARSIESALAAVAPFSGKVVLADSGSTDDTVVIARQYPITVVQLRNPDEKCCGVGAQLGYQFVDADYLYVLDGDMELIPGFVARAIDHLEAHADLAGVGGTFDELGGGSYEFEVRKATGDGRLVGRQEALDGGGLYRVEAIRRIGYLTNRNLHSYEEKELGLRLRRNGYFLERLAVKAVRHYGKTDNSSTLLMKRWRSRYLDGPGEWIRFAWGSGDGLAVAMRFGNLWVVVAGWLALGLSAILLPFSSKPMLVVLCLHSLLFAWLWSKRRSALLAWLGFVNLQAHAAGMIRGLSRNQLDPSEPVAAIVLHGGDK